MFRVDTAGSRPLDLDSRSPYADVGQLEQRRSISGRSGWSTVGASQIPSPKGDDMRRRSIEIDSFAHANRIPVPVRHATPSRRAAVDQ
jgi:hypothetical protein